MGLSGQLGVREHEGLGKYLCGAKEKIITIIYALHRRQFNREHFFKQQPNKERWVFMQEVAALEEIIITLELCSLPFFFLLFFLCVCY